MLRDELLSVHRIVGVVLDEWKERAKRMSLDNQCLNPNDDLFDRLKDDLKDRLAVSVSFVVER